MQQVLNYFRTFAREEDGAQIIEYALLVAVVSLVLIALFTTLASGGFTTWITNVGTCLSTSVCP